MALVYLSLGSNVNARINIQSCMRQLQLDFEKITSSRIYQTPAEGFKGDDFLNSVVGLETTLSLEALKIRLREIEDAHGRKRSCTEKFNSRTLDIDLLLYDDMVIETNRYTLPHGDIVKYGFVLYPLAEIAPGLVHPLLGITMQQMAENSPLSRSNMKAITL